MIHLIQFSKFLYSAIGYKLFVWVFIIITGVVLEGISFAFFIPLIELGTGQDTFKISQSAPYIAGILRYVGGYLTVTNTIAIMALAFTLRTVVIVFQMLYVNAVIKRLYINLVQNIITELYECSYKFYVTVPYKRLYSTIMGETSKINQASNQYVSLISTTLMAMMYCTIAIMINPVVSLSIIFSLFIVYMLHSVFVKKIRSHSRSIALTNEFINGNIVQFLNNYKYFKYVNDNIPFMKDTFAAISKAANLQAKNNILRSMSSHGLQLTLVLIFCCVIFLELNVFNSKFIEILFVIFIIKRAADWLVNSFNMYTGFYGFIGSIERYNMLREEMSANKEKHHRMEQTRVTKLDDIHLDNVCFAYLDKPVLDDVSISIKLNTTTFISGHSGSGKTTLAYMLLGILSPDTGRIRVGDHDYSDIDRRTLNEHMAYMSQTSVMFNDSMRNNITLWDSTSLDRHDNAVLVADIEKLLDNIPLDMDDIIEMNGSNISGGQQQRIQLVRELYKNAQMIILDEVTNNMDYQTVRLIKRLVHDSHGKKTIIIIDHDTVLSANCDQYITMNEGKIEDCGNQMREATDVPRLDERYSARSRPRI